MIADTLRQLVKTFDRINQVFYVIGATARDILFQQLADEKPMRKTRDLDFAVAIPDWSAFEVISNALVASGFRKDPGNKQRFLYGKMEVDVVPYGRVAKDDTVYWPPEETPAMLVKGFEEVLRAAVEVRVDDEFSFKMASLPGIFLMKLAAWLDRHTVTSKDAEDMACIMACYFAANCSRNPHSEVYEWPDFDIGKAGVYWLGLDLSVLLTSEQRAYYRKCIEKEIKNPGGSALFDLKDVFGTSYEHLRSQWECLVKAL